MSIKKSSPLDMIFYLAFLAFVYLVLSFIHLPEKEEFTIVYDEMKFASFEEKSEPEVADNEGTVQEYTDDFEAASAGVEESQNNDVFETKEPPKEAQASIGSEKPKKGSNPDAQAQALIDNGKRAEVYERENGGLSRAEKEAPFRVLDKSSGLSTEEYFAEFVKLYEEYKMRGVRPESRTDVVIRYYNKRKDGRKVYALEKLGFYIHERPTSERFDDYMSNAIYYGANVSDIDIKMVAYTLMQQGVEIKVIEPSQFFRDWKAHSVEIGTDDTKIDARPITLEDLRALKIR